MISILDTAESKLTKTGLISLTKLWSVYKFMDFFPQFLQALLTTLIEHTES